MRVRTDWSRWGDGILGLDWFFGHAVWWFGIHLGPASLTFERTFGR